MNEIEDGLICRRDRTATRLRCASCDDAVCVRCLVRTPVGQKCAACAQVGSGGTGARSGRTSAAGASGPVATPSVGRRRWAVLLEALLSPVPR